MSPAFLVYIAAKRKAEQRVRNQYTSNLPTGIV
jgi:hypothetical protein